MAIIELEGVSRWYGNTQALQDITLQLQPGRIGLLGPNGAGKSTLLKILSRITEPTEGRVTIKGRVASLLEVGTGFHPELTGRENIYLNGAILGMTRGEMRRKFDEIVAFAEVEKFLDTPVKRYSSGMYVRLAFAVAAHLEPEILIVDEVLAVGDTEFQKKCLGKMEDVSHSGRTVIFVSHNMSAVTSLTRKSALLQAGKCVFFGETQDALSKYRAEFCDEAHAEYIDCAKSTGVVRARVTTSEPRQIHRFGQPISFEFELKFASKPQKSAFSFQVLDEEMRPIMWVAQCDTEQNWSQTGSVLLRCVIQRPRIYMGRYTVRTHVGDRGSCQHFETLEGVSNFEVVLDGVVSDYDWPPGACTFIEDAEWAVLPGEPKT
jgi:lipopolysaccharide transport system ATP-binding protein